MSNKKKKKELTFKQRKAIIIMIKQNIKSYAEIASIVGVSPRTLFNWRKQEEFSQAYKEAFKDLKRRMESSVEFPIQLGALGDLKNYKATAINQVEIANAINELIERKLYLIKKTRSL
jgi:transposase-like protein